MNMTQAHSAARNARAAGHDRKTDMKQSISAPLALIALAALGAAGTALAHHSFAHFDSTKHTLVEGTVTNWSYSSPHSWLYVDALDASGMMQKWSFEGAAPIHATRQGVTGETFKKGEKIRVVMSPIRDGRPAGAACFVVKEDGSVAQPNDGTCDAPAVYKRWKEKGWLDTGKHLDTHPLAD
jgi:Family of unknown function (DUF6152)